jgi:hypothetical protein
MFNTNEKKLQDQIMKTMGLAIEKNKSKQSRGGNSTRDEKAGEEGEEGKDGKKRKEKRLRVGCESVVQLSPE